MLNHLCSYGAGVFCFKGKLNGNQAIIKRTKFVLYSTRKLLQSDIFGIGQHRVVMKILLVEEVFRYPFIEIPGTVARERNCGWTFTGPRHSIYGALGGVLPTYNLLVLWIGYRILKRQGVFNPVAEGKSGG